MYQLELAKSEDAEFCNDIISAGKSFQKEQGFTQWTDDYPNLDTIRDDIKTGKGYVIKVKGKIAGYLCIDFGGEPAYDNIDGKWQTEEPYAVVHRMAFSGDYRGMGLTDITFQLIDALCGANNMKSIRVDTDFPNKRMQHILEKNSFRKCGVIIFQGSGKLAYDKTL